MSLIEILPIAKAPNHFYVEDLDEFSDGRFVYLMLKITYEVRVFQKTKQKKDIKSLYHNTIFSLKLIV